MATQRAKETVDLDTLLTEKVPQTIVAAIDDIAVGLEPAEAEVYIGVRKGSLVAKAHVSIPLRRKLIIGGMVITIWFVFPEFQSFLLPLLTHLR